MIQDLAADFNNSWLPPVVGTSGINIRQAPSALDVNLYGFTEAVFSGYYDQKPQDLTVTKTSDGTSASTTHTFTGAGTVGQQKIFGLHMSLKAPQNAQIVDHEFNIAGTAPTGDSIDFDFSLTAEMSQFERESASMYVFPHIPYQNTSRYVPFAFNAEISAGVWAAANLVITTSSGTPLPSGTSLVISPLTRGMAVLDLAVRIRNDHKRIAIQEGTHILALRRDKLPPFNF
jgi:hypothetical protein